MNAGGKTTYLESVGLLLITAKAFGICFAENATFTEFGRIFTVIDITTDISKGFSRYKSEVAVCNMLISAIEKALKKGEKVFVAIDELFAGTNPESCGNLFTNVLKFIVKSENTAGCMATHNKKPTEVEKTSNGIVKNHRMHVDISSTGHVRNLYKVIEGALDESIAESIIIEMARQGLISKVAAEAMLGFKI